MASKEASDLHLKPMRPPLLRIKGKLVPLKSEALQPKELEEMLLEILSPSQREKLEVHQSVDLGYGLPGVARFRANVYVQRGSLAAVFRRIPFKLPSIEDLNLPEVLETFVSLPAGLVLITGPTVSGKSTTLAAILRSVIEQRQARRTKILLDERAVVWLTSLRQLRPRGATPEIHPSIIPNRPLGQQLS